jgi:serine/threonine-protein kinase RsbW
LENDSVKSLEIPSIPDGMTQVEAFLESIQDLYCFKDDVCGNVMIAVTEAVNNSIHHGNKCDASKMIRLEAITPNPYRLLIRVTDEGDGFDADTLPDPTSPELIDKPGGRGVFLMRHLADSIEFKDQGRTVELYFNI